MCVLSFEDGMVAESWYAWLAFRTRVSMSAIGSVIVMSVVPLSPRFLSPSGWCRRAGPLGERWCSVVDGTARLQGPAAREARRGGQPGPSPAGLADAGELPGVRHLP